MNKQETALDRACARMSRINSNAPQQVRTAVDLALKWALGEKPHKPRKLEETVNTAEHLLGLLVDDAVRPRLVMAAQLENASPDTFLQVLSNLISTAGLTSTGAPIDGAQGRTPFTRFVRALDRLMRCAYGRPRIPAKNVADLCAELLHDSRTTREIRLLRLRKYVDEDGSEIGEIIPDYMSRNSASKK